MIEPRSFENPSLQKLIRVLIDWVNDELHHYRIIVQDVEEDLYDGQVHIFSDVPVRADGFEINLA